MIHDIWLAYLEILIGTLIGQDRVVRARLIRARQTGRSSHDLVVPSLGPSLGGRDVVPAIFAVNVRTFRPHATGAAPEECVVDDCPLLKVDVEENVATSRDVHLSVVVPEKIQVPVGGQECVRVTPTFCVKRIARFEDSSQHSVGQPEVLAHHPEFAIMMPDSCGVEAFLLSFGLMLVKIHEVQWPIEGSHLTCLWFVE